MHSKRPARLLRAVLVRVLSALIGLQAGITLGQLVPPPADAAASSMAGEERGPTPLVAPEVIEGILREREAREEARPASWEAERQRRLARLSDAPAGDATTYGTLLAAGWAGKSSGAPGGKPLDRAPTTVQTLLTGERNRALSRQRVRSRFPCHLWRLMGRRTEAD